jgi:hypothetical protein
MLTAGISLPIGWAAARPFLFAGGLSVQASFFIQRRAIDQPHAITRWNMTTQGAASALILLAGIALVTIGYHAAREGWWPISTTTVIPIAAAVVASTLNQRAAAIRLARRVSPSPSPAIDTMRRHRLGDTTAPGINVGRRVGEPGEDDHKCACSQ